MRVQSLEKSSLVRLSDEMQANIGMFEAQMNFAEPWRAMLRRFLQALDNPSTSDADFERHMTNYVSYGTFLASHSPIHATFLLRRHAAMHFWLKDRAIEVLRDSVERSVSARNRIERAK